MPDPGLIEPRVLRNEQGLFEEVDVVERNIRLRQPTEAAEVSSSEGFAARHPGSIGAAYSLK